MQSGAENQRAEMVCQGCNGRGEVNYYGSTWKHSCRKCAGTGTRAVAHTVADAQREAQAQSDRINATEARVQAAQIERRESYAAQARAIIQASERGKADDRSDPQELLERAADTARVESNRQEAAAAARQRLLDTITAKAKDGEILESPEIEFVNSIFWKPAGESSAASWTRLANKARALGVRVKVAGDGFSCTSVSNPGLIYACSATWCTCKGFAGHGVCMHAAAVAAATNSLPQLQAAA